ncbi:MAG TPA: transketolase C-terminal domain-containing protein [Alphaproteobacteria bacterium]|nr:transketolase C-terminal domain-containing protein [Alphaproteobacteria bacterium]
MDFRDSVFDAIIDIMKVDPSVIGLTNDMGAMRLDQMRKDWPERVINIGIAEQNMMSVMGGLARAGKVVFGFGIGAHVATRGWEQIKLDICGLNLPVTLVGVGGGLAYGNDGITHHATEDVALMLTLPNMAIYNPCDPQCTMLSIQHAYKRRGPAYLRLDKEQVKEIYVPRQDVSKGYVIFREGGDATLISTGVITYKALEAADLLATEGINIRVADISRIKPFDSWKEVIGKGKRVYTLEEHNITNAMGSQVAVHLATHGGPPLTMLGLPDQFLEGSAARPWAHEKFGLTPTAIAARIKKDLKA